MKVNFIIIIFQLLGRKVLDNFSINIIYIHYFEWEIFEKLLNHA